MPEWKYVVTSLKFGDLGGEIHVVGIWESEGYFRVAKIESNRVSAMALCLELNQ